MTNAETYQGAVGVNKEGKAVITFTRSGSSSADGWPSLAAALLTADYSDIQYEFEQGFEAGPAQALSSGGGVFERSLGQDYADIQHDPVNCRFWRVGTVVACNDCQSPTAPATSDVRAIWVTELLLGCGGNAEMNGDGVVDELDLLLYLDHYAKGTPQADMNGDKVVDTVDYLIYSEEYAKR